MIYISAQQSVHEDLFDASKIDGSNASRSFRHNVNPQISPSILMVFMLTIVGSFKVFELVLLLTEGGPGVQSSVLSFEIYKQAFRLNNIGYASALAVLLFAIVLALTGIIWQARKWLVFHESE
jgi:multiple sugar transport system permease protein